jgi:hypothetical protein
VLPADPEKFGTKEEPMHGYRIATFAALLTIASAGVALAQAMPTNDPEAKANVRESERFDALLRSSPAFRQKRMQIECGPITDAQLHESCVASFQNYGPTPAPSKRRAPPTQ